MNKQNLVVNQRVLVAIVWMIGNQSGLLIYPPPLILSWNGQVAIDDCSEQIFSSRTMSGRILGIINLKHNQSCVTSGQFSPFIVIVSMNEENQSLVTNELVKVRDFKKNVPITLEDFRGYTSNC